MPKNACFSTFFTPFRVHSGRVLLSHVFSFAGSRPLLVDRGPLSHTTPVRFLTNVRCCTHHPCCHTQTVSHTHTHGHPCRCPTPVRSLTRDCCWWTDSLVRSFVDQHPLLSAFLVVHASVAAPAVVTHAPIVTHTQCCQQTCIRVGRLYKPSAR